jgi:hypothetical protein
MLLLLSHAPSIHFTSDTCGFAAEIVVGNGWFLGAGIERTVLESSRTGTTTSEDCVTDKLGLNIWPGEVKS